MTGSVDQVVDGLQTRLRALGTPERAAGEKRYLKSDLDFLGATVWQTRGEVRGLAQGLEPPTHGRLVQLVEALWSRPVFDLRLAAALLLDARPALVEPEDLDLIERLVRESKTWALVDVLAGDVAGELLVRHPSAAGRLHAWARDEDFWVRRAALLSNLRPIAHGEPLDRFFRYAEPMLGETEFFIRKAIGWVLREAGKRRPAEVYAWLAPRARSASGVTLREAVKYLRPDQRDALMNAYRRASIRPGR